MSDMTSNESHPKAYLSFTRQEPRPDFGKDKSAGWKEYFAQQEICNLGGNVRVLVKSGEVSPTGVMVMRDDVGSPTELSAEEAHDLFNKAGQVARIERDMYPGAPVTFIHYNISEEVPIRTPQELGPMPRDKNPKTSQTLYPFHIHVDTKLERGYPIYGLRDIWDASAKAYGLNGATDGAETEKKQAIVDRTTRELTRQVTADPAVKLAASIWHKEMVPELIRDYPDLFEALPQNGKIEGYPLQPAVGIIVKPGLEAFEKSEFTEAVLQVHRRVEKEWKLISQAVESLRDGNETELGDFRVRHPWVDQSQEKVLKRYAKTIKTREGIANVKWLHALPNFTIYISAKAGEPVVLGVDPRFANKTGIQSGGFVSVRDPNLKATPEEVTLRRTFRAQLAKKLQEAIPGAQLGEEGKRCIGQAMEIV